MAKFLNQEELAELVTSLLVNPEELGCLDEQDSFMNFMRDIAGTVSNYSGGEVVSVSPSSEIETSGEYFVGIVADEYLPDLKDNVWSGYDPDGDL
jgi:hypothetical protein